MLPFVNSYGIGHAGSRSSKGTGRILVHLSTQCEGCLAPMAMFSVGAKDEPCGPQCVHASRPNHVVRRLYFMGDCARCRKVSEQSFRV